MEIFVYFYRSISDPMKEFTGLISLTLKYMSFKFHNDNIFPRIFYHIIYITKIISIYLEGLHPICKDLYKYFYLT